MGETCCLCSKVLETASDKKTRKRFNRAGCVPERAILDRVLKKKNSQFVLSSFPKLKYVNALLCAVCSRLLLRIRRLEEDLAKDIAVVYNHLGLCNENFPTPIAPRKRLLSDSSDGNDAIATVDGEEMASNMEESRDAHGTGVASDVTSSSNQCNTMQC